MKKPEKEVGKTKKSTTKPARKFVPTKSGWKAFFYGILLAVWVYAVLVAFQFVTALVFMLILGKEQAREPLWTTIMSAVFYILTAMFLILVTPKLARKWGFMKPTRKGLGLEGEPTWTDLGLGAVGFVVSIVLAAALVKFFEIFPWFDATETQQLIYNTGIVGVERVIAFVMLVVVAPIVEELIFRGWLYEKLRIKLPVPVSILITSVLFGAVHSPFSASLNVFAMSVVLCCLRELTGTIYAGIILHILKNGLAFFLVFVFKI